MSRVYTEEDVFAFEAAGGESLAPVDVHSYVDIMNAAIQMGFGIPTENDSEAKVAKIRKFKDYLKKLYDGVIVKGKEFKKGLSSVHDTVSAEDDDTEKEAKAVGIPGFKGNVVEFSVKGVCWAGVIKGKASDKTTRPSLFQFDDTDGEKCTIPIVTVKLFQACISILIVRQRINRDLTPAPLCANIFRACKKENVDVWKIHGHSGFNFVASYVWKLKAPKGDKESDEQVEARKSMATRMPKIEDMMMMALRLDEANLKKMTRKEKEGAEPYQAVKSIIQSCQIQEKDLEPILKNIDPAIWGQSAISAAGEVSRTFASRVAKKTKVPDKKVQKRDDEEDESTVY